MCFIVVLGNTVGAGYNYLDLLVSHFLFPIRDLVTKCDLRCFVALAGILPARRYVLTCRSNTRVPVLLPEVPVPLLVGLTHPCCRILRHFLLGSCFGTWESVREF